MNGAVDTLENRIPLRTICGGPGFLVPKDRLQLFHELVLKFLPLIRMQSFRWAEYGKDTVNKVTDHYCGFLGLDRSQNEEACEVIDDRQDKSVTFRLGFVLDKINRNDLEWFSDRPVPCRQRRRPVRRFAVLTRQTAFDVFRDIRVHRGR